MEFEAVYSTLSRLTNIGISQQSMKCFGRDAKILEPEVTACDCLTKHYMKSNSFVSKKKNIKTPHRFECMLKFYGGEDWVIEVLTFVMAARTMDRIFGGRCSRAVSSKML